jgi:hypothetical protein
VISLAAWLIANIALISFLEYVVHCQFIHRRFLPLHLYQRFPFLEDYFHAHAILHHTTYYRRFNFEPDPSGREIDLRLSLKTGLLLYASVSPLVIALAVFSPLGAIAISIVAATHMYLWGVLHHEMHVPKSRFLQQSASYRFLARYHFLHHRYPKKNFNVVVPLADFFLGTRAHPRPCDLREMIRLGYLTPSHHETIDRLVHRNECPSLPAHGTS